VHIVLKTYITDVLGNIKIIKNCPIMTTGVAKEEIETDELTPGLYLYSLEVNNKYIATKKMIISD
jgi:hypothetical protein